MHIIIVYTKSYLIYSIFLYNTWSCNYDMCNSFFLFKKINILLHRAQWQTVVATFVTTYRRSRHTWGEKREREKEKKKKEKEDRTN